MNVGPGGDLFLIVYVAREKKLYALNASGKAPSGQTLARMNGLGYQWDPKDWGPGSGMPARGILTVTVPGAVWGWEEVLRRFGTMTFKETLQPAIDYAEQGFPVSERIAFDWTLPNAVGPVASDARRCCTARDADAVATWYVNGQKPSAGQILRNPGLARTFRLLQQQGRDVFYRGEIARALVDKSTSLGGSMTMDDLAAYTGEWVTPATTTYHGYDVFTLPPPAQTWATDEILNILEVCMPVWAPGQTLASLGPASAEVLALRRRGQEARLPGSLRLQRRPQLREGAARPAAVEGAREVAVRARQSGSRVHAGGGQSGRHRRRHHRAHRRRSRREHGGVGEQPVLLVRLRRDGARATASRCTTAAACSRSIRRAPTLIAPHKRPYNTLSAGFVMRNERPLMAVTLMGGDMQAQGIAQVLLNVLDLGANVQAASDMARFRHLQVANTLTMESPLAALVGPALRSMGHNVRSVNGIDMGGYQAVMFTPDEGSAPAAPGSPVRGFYRAGSDHRKDGAAVGY